MSRPDSMIESAQLREVRKRRIGLRHAMTDVEIAASAALAGRPREWRSTLVPMVDELRDAWESHVSGTEGPGGLWEQIRTDAPRLTGELQRLGREHKALAAEIEALRRNLADAGEDETRLLNAREQTTALLVRLAKHRQRGADLIYEAYERDVGGNG